MSPPVPDVAVPVPKKTYPEFPSVVVPVLNEIEPETPSLPALAVTSDMKPLELDVPYPDWKMKEPPVAKAATPPNSSMFPPRSPSVYSPRASPPYR